MANLSPGPLNLPPKRPDVRDALLQAASELIIERDTLEVALTDVAQRASVNSALIQYYFGNKDGFLLALLERDIGDAVRRMRILLASDGSALDKLTTHLSGLARAYHRVPYLNRLLRLMRFSRMMGGVFNIVPSCKPNCSRILRPHHQTPVAFY